jgi:hypothetical protein
MAIERVLWNGHNIESRPEWIQNGLKAVKPPNKEVGAIMRVLNEVHVGTKFGVQIAMPGDSICYDTESKELCVQTAYEVDMSEVY